MVECAAMHRRGLLLFCFLSRDSDGWFLLIARVRDGHPLGESTPG
jgi:hypothetical protein